MLPFVVAGGIFIALAFLIDTLMGAPQDANFGTNTPVAAFFKTIGGYAFNFMIPVLSAFIAKSIADRPGFLVGLVGGFLATTGSTFTAVGGDVPSGFLGALFAGFVGGYLMLGVEKLLSKLPKSLEGIKPVLIFPLVGIGLIAVIMCAVNPIMGMLNTGLTNLLNSMGSTSKVLLGVVLGAMMSTDMGGPFNKAAYVFGTAAITSGNYDIMAAVMVGGMVPPLAIALATTFFKKKFTAQERKSGPVNYILGLSFITEGAIPYAASDPLRVIPACMIGAGLAGGLSMLFKCTLMAPHGGIFVFAVVGNWPYYLLALAAGSVVSMLLLGLFKKKVKEEEFQGEKTMVSKKVTVVNAMGFHMRPAMNFSNAMMKYPCDVTIKANGNTTDCKSIMAIIAACIKCGTEVEVICDGEKEKEALDEAVSMIENGLGE